MFPELIVKRKLTNEASQWLSRNVSNDEIQAALFQMSPDKAPGPDGYNAFFFQKKKDIIGTDICRAIHSFFNSGRILTEVNHTLITLVPKSPNASVLSDFRPISCCNTIYKLISNILANRLQRVIGELISPNQSAFLKGRIISAVSLLAHELVRDFNKTMGSRLCLKVDLQKAFDTLNKEFIYYMFHCMGFSHRWIKWIKECLYSASFSIMLNGSPAGNFSSSRGVRQGCPLSPYLFVMVMEFWTMSMDMALASRAIYPLRRTENLIISNLLFADDLLVLCKENLKFAIGINESFE